MAMHGRCLGGNHEVDSATLVLDKGVEKPKATVRRLRNSFSARCTLEDCVVTFHHPDFLELPSQNRSFYNADLSKRINRSVNFILLYSQFLKTIIFLSLPFIYAAQKFSKATTVRLQSGNSDVLILLKTFSLFTMAAWFTGIKQEIIGVYNKTYLYILRVIKKDFIYTGFNTRTLIDKQRKASLRHYKRALIKVRFSRLPKIRKFFSDKVICTLFKNLSRNDSNRAAFAVSQFFATWKVPAKRSQELFIQLKRFSI
jgi:hypothetical protein